MDKYIYLIKRELKDPDYFSGYIACGIVICESSQQKALDYWYSKYQGKSDFTYIEQLAKANDSCSLGVIMAKYIDD